jgi:hypothetical protein
MRKNNKAQTQDNITKILSLIYGLNSGIILRHVLKTVAQQKGEALDNVIISLEALESITETLLIAMLNNLEIDWETSDLMEGLSPELVNQEPYKSNIKLMNDKIP